MPPDSEGCVYECSCEEQPWGCWRGECLRHHGQIGPEVALKAGKVSEVDIAIPIRVKAQQRMPIKALDRRAAEDGLQCEVADAHHVGQVFEIDFQLP